MKITSLFFFATTLIIAVNPLQAEQSRSQSVSARFSLETIPLSRPQENFRLVTVQPITVERDPILTWRGTVNGRPFSAKLSPAGRVSLSVRF